MNENIKELLEKKKITQAELAEAAGTSQAFISNMLKGYKTPSVATLKRIADYLNVTVDELI